MIEAHDDDHDFRETFREAYERTALPHPAARARLQMAVRGAARPSPSALANGFDFRPISLHPLAAMAAAVALVVAGALIGAVLTQRRAAPGSDGIAVSPAPGVAVAVAPLPTHVVRFVLVAPASRVNVVGDFNGWDERATPMTREGAAETWTTRVRLPAGWHAYAFVVDGEWLPDPQAPSTPADDYGSRRSVVVVGDNGT